ncbi:DNA primase [Microbacteriaceae bacterium VKM Ac-2854]|nr:DNA primase [Microbacteriaceae bacterium VKM Ac-2854]
MPGRIKQSDVEEVKARTNIADIVGDYVTLKSAGIGSMKGLCPFHDERSPSFHVRPQAGFYHCFGCQESGDVYSFIMKMDHSSFSETVERLAAKIGYTLHYEDGDAPKEERGNRARIIAANQAAEEFFRAQLATPGADIGRQFLGERGFDKAAADRFGVGFAPNSWDELLKHLKGRGFTEEELKLSGLVSSNDRGGIYDRFRGRLVWPIRDVTGATVGFGARRLLEDDKGPKYLNTPETPVYHKAQVLYGLDLAKRDISRAHQVVVVEGYTDVMACHLAGVTTAVATCGTAFGTDHVRIVRRVLGDTSGAAEVVFTFDPDTAGQKAALRAFETTQSSSARDTFSAQTFVAVAPDGLDPCDLRINRGDDAVRRLIDERKPMYEFAIRQRLSQYTLTNAEGQVAALRVAAPLVAEIPDEALRPEYTRRLAKMLGLDMDEVTAAVRSASMRAANATRHHDDSTAAQRRPEPDERDDERGGPAHAAPADGPRARLEDLPTDVVTRIETEALSAMLQFPQLLGQKLLDRALSAAVTNETLEIVRQSIDANLSHAMQPDFAQRVAEMVPQPFVNLVLQLAVVPLPTEDEAKLTAYVRGIIHSLIERDILREHAALVASLRRAEDPEVVRTLQGGIIVLEQRRRELRSE